MAIGREMEGRKIAVVGMARSGIAAAHLCLRKGARPICLELERSSVAAEEIAAIEAEGGEWIFGPHPIDLLESCDRVVKSPGVPSSIEFLEATRRKGIPIVSEIELAWSFARGPLLGVTGTNGKSTTVSWIADILSRCGRACELAGNIGRPLAGVVDKAAEGAILVVEISSFQLEEVISFRPTGALLLNLSPDHLDRHHDLEDYREAKMRIFSQQTAEDHAVIGRQEDLAEELARRFRPRLLRFGRIDTGGEGAFTRRGRIVVRFAGDERELCTVGEIALPGRHNLENALAALAILLPLGIANEGTIESLTHFSGLAHRLEQVAVIGGVTFINDSKATNIESLATALEAFDAPLLLLAGGRGKGQSFESLRAGVERSCRKVFLFGEDASVIHAAWGNRLCEIAEDLAEALLRAVAAACPGDIVLLSPACASFDQFRDYEERGDHFRERVQQLREVREI